MQTVCNFDVDHVQDGRLAAMFVPERARNNQSIAAKTKRYLDDSKVVLGRPWIGGRPRLGDILK